MPYYHRLGNIPQKRHTQFRNQHQNLYHEELFSTEGFSEAYSLLYHCHPPTVIKQIGEPYSVQPNVLITKQLKPISLLGFELKPEPDFLKSRIPLLVNADCHISLAAPQNPTQDYFYKNVDADELIFIHQGSGTLKTAYGSIQFEYGDYLVIPRGTIYQINFDAPDNRLLILESFSPITFPSRYVSNRGQLLEHAPFCERDFKLPTNLETNDQAGEFPLFIKKQGMMYPYLYAFHPFDLIGWDGYHYPYALSIHNFEPITGRIHQPPPVHQTFQTKGLVVCSFVPRLFDYHPLSIPAPYHHSNIDSDEVLYYVDGDFMSRKNVKRGQITLHPGGIPHGPHPGTIEKTIGAKETKELAVMIDTFKPLQMTQNATNIEDPNYYLSWLDYSVKKDNQ